MSQRTRRIPEHRDSPAVLALSLPGRACYMWLLLDAWRMPEPGRFPKIGMAALCRVTPEVWDTVALEVTRCLGDAGDFWEMPDVVAAHEVESTRRGRMSAGGKRSAQVRGGLFGDGPLEAAAANGVPETRAQQERDARRVFPTFWEAYPRKVGRVEAEEEFVKAVRSQADYDAVMDGLEWWIEREWRDVEEKKIPHARTWLHQRRWVDTREETR